MIENAAEREEKREKIEKDREKQFLERKLAFNRIFATSDGELLGKWLMNECGFLLPSILFSREGNILSESTVYNEARRSLYLELRKYLDVDSLINLEIRE